MKRCSKCGEAKEVSFYYPRSDKQGDGYTSRCRACTTVDQAAYAQANKDQRRAADRARRRTRDPEPKREASRRYRRAAMDSDPEGTRAKERTRAKKARDNLADWYVKKLVPEPLMDLKREQILTNRLIKQLKQQINLEMENLNGN